VSAYLANDELDDLALPPDTREGATPDQKTAAISAASAIADGHLVAGGVTLPLTSWGDDLREAVAAIAAFNLATTLGLAPESGERSNLYLRRKAALDWLTRVGEGKVKPVGLVDADPTVPATVGVSLITNARRGW